MRYFNIIVLCFAFSICLLSCQNEENSEQALVNTSIQLNADPFQHGVASGDPLSDAVIIWTRVSVDTQSTATVKWLMSTDKDFTEIAQSGFAETSSDRDFTVKVDVGALESNKYYYYKFELGDYTSAIGRTKTSPSILQKVSQVRLGVVSCSNYEAGYYNAYARLADKKDIDAVLHLGDYIYEYGAGVYGDTTIDRKHEPPTEIISLSDYRTRYAQYRRDTDLQSVHQAHPFISIWDDHEISNNAYVEGAENHDASEGDYQQRRAIAKQVYYEWMPIREGDKLYRHFTFGEIVSLFMLDERLEGRTAPVESKDAENYLSEDRSMLGKEQMDWLVANLEGSTQRWKVIGNQVVFSTLDVAALPYGQSLNMDAWDGYPADRKRLMDAIKGSDIENIVFVSGDTHCSLAFEVPISKGNYNPRTSEGVVAIEFGTPGITSANLDERFPEQQVIEMEQNMRQSNKHLKYVDLRKQGYFILDMNASQIRAEYYYTDIINEPSKLEYLGKTIIARRGKNQLVVGQ